VRSAELARTQPRSTAKVVEVVQGARGSDTYYLELDGEEIEADYGWFIPDPTPGAAVEVVRDPEDSGRVIAVGRQEDWADRPVFNALLWLLAVGTGAAIASAVALKLIPERTEPVLETMLDAGGRTMRRADRLLQRWLGRRRPPSGRRSAGNR
jgi:hypothetical protein